MRSMKNRYLPMPSWVTQKMPESDPRSCCCNRASSGCQISQDLGSSIEASARALGWGYLGRPVLEAPCPRLITNEYGSYHWLSKPQFSSMYPPPPSQVTVCGSGPRDSAHCWRPGSGPVTLQGCHHEARTGSELHTFRRQVWPPGTGQQLSFLVWATVVPIPWLPRSKTAATQTRLPWHILGAECSSRQWPTAISSLEVVPGDHSYLLSRLSHEEWPEAIALFLGM